MATDATDVEEVTIQGKRNFGPWIQPTLVYPDPPLDNDHQQIGEPGEPTVVENEETKKRKDCAAKNFKDKLPAFGKDKFEYGAFSYKDSSGDLVTHDPVRGTGQHPGSGIVGTGIRQADLLSIMSALGISAAEVLSFTHNHPQDYYCPTQTPVSLRQNEQRVNAFPSANDWDAADWLVDQGADPDQLTMYIVGCDGALRAYPYSGRDAFLAALASGQPPAAKNPQDCPSSPQ